jgi:hypothetical protein
MQPDPPPRTEFELPNEDAAPKSLLALLATLSSMDDELAPIEELSTDDTVEL